MDPLRSSSRVRLKCRYEDEIRIVIINRSHNYQDLKDRLKNDFGFEVSLKYQDQEGDLITLASQNDLNCLLESEIDNINVIVSETLLPNLNTSRTPQPTSSGPRPIQSSLSSSKNSSYLTRQSSRVERFDRFPQIESNLQNVNNDVNRQIRWKQGEILGQGAFGVVYLGLNIDTGELMAVKKMSLDEVSSRELSSLENEINLLRTLKHPNIVRYIGTEIAPGSLAIFLEYVPGGSLKALIDKFGHLEEAVVRSYTRQILLGLEYLHRNGIAHRDIKGANCLVGNIGVVKLSDFGASKQWRPAPSGSSVSSGHDIRGTPLWMAPEVIQNQDRNLSWKKADVWSIGCTTIEMTTGKPPWSQFSNTVTVMYHLACQETLPEYPETPSMDLVTFLNVCMQRNPVKRPDITSLLLHPFVASSAGLAGWGSVSQPQLRPSTVSTTPMPDEGNFMENVWRQEMKGRRTAQHRGDRDRGRDIDRDSTPLPINLSTQIQQQRALQLSRNSNNEISNANPEIVVPMSAVPLSISAPSTSRTYQSNHSVASTSASVSSQADSEEGTPRVHNNITMTNLRRLQVQHQHQPESSPSNPHRRSRRDVTDHLDDANDLPYPYSEEALHLSASDSLATINLQDDLTGGRNLGLISTTESQHNLQSELVPTISILKTRSDSSSSLLSMDESLPEDMGHSHSQSVSMSHPSENEEHIVRSGESVGSGLGSLEESFEQDVSVIIDEGGNEAETSQRMMNQQQGIALNPVITHRRKPRHRDGAAAAVDDMSHTGSEDSSRQPTSKSRKDGIRRSALPLSPVIVRNVSTDVHLGLSLLSNRSNRELDDVVSTNRTASKLEGSNWGASADDTESQILLGGDEIKDDFLLSTNSARLTNRDISSTIQIDTRMIENSLRKRPTASNASLLGLTRLPGPGSPSTLLTPLTYIGDNDMGFSVHNEVPGISENHTFHGSLSDDDLSTPIDSSTARIRGGHRRKGSTGSESYRNRSKSNSRVASREEQNKGTEDGVSQKRLNSSRLDGKQKSSTAKVHPSQRNSSAGFANAGVVGSSWATSLESGDREKMKDAKAGKINSSLAESIPGVLGVSLGSSLVVQPLRQPTASPGLNVGFGASSRGTGSSSSGTETPAANQMRALNIPSSQRQRSGRGTKGVYSSLDSPTQVLMSFDNDSLDMSALGDSFELRAGTGTSSRTQSRAGSSLGLASRLSSRRVSLAPPGLVTNEAIDHGFVETDEIENSISEAAQPMIYEEHTSSITRLNAPSKTRGLIVSSSLDGTVKIWSSNSTESLVTLSSSPVSSLGGGQTTEEISNGLPGRPDSKAAMESSSKSSLKFLTTWTDETCETIWGGGSDGGIRVWSSGEGRVQRVLKGHDDGVTALTGLEAGAGTGPAGNLPNPSCLVASGSVDRTVRVWDLRVRRSQVLLLKGHTDTVISVHWGDYGRAIVSASKDKTIRVWDTRSGRIRSCLEKHFSAVTSVKIIPEFAPASNGRRNTPGEPPSYITAGRDSMLHLWSQSGDCVGTQAGHRGAIHCLSNVRTDISLNYATLGAPLVLSGGSDGLVRMWDLRRFKLLSEINCGVPTKVCWVGQSILTGGVNGSLKLWDYYSSPQENMQGVVNTAASDGPQWSGRDLFSHTSACTDLVCTDNVVASGSKNGQILRWAR